MIEEEYTDNVDSNIDDTITAVEYNANGEYLATGDRVGRITVLKLENEGKEKQKQENWLPYFQYQSHDPEFDFLKSLEIEAKINQIKFCGSSSSSNTLLSANDKTIKLWKISSRNKYDANAVSSYQNDGVLRFPTRSRSETLSRANTAQRGESKECDPDSSIATPLHASTKKVYSNAHAYHINSLATNSDGQTFVSSDDLRVNWWNMDCNDTCFNVVDIKPENMEELTEVITSVEFHPFNCALLTFSSSRGAIKVVDTRTSALCRGFARTYQETQREGANGSKSFIADILNSISDVTYSKDGRFLVSRDYLTVKIWDVNMENKPVKTISLHDHLRPMLYDLFTSDIIFDKFEVCCSPDGKRFASGSYSNQLKVFNGDDGRGLRDITLPTVASEPGAPLAAQAVDEASGIVDVTRSLQKSSLSARRSTSASEVRLDEKVLHCSWHPVNNTIAVAGHAGLCLYKV
uniref:Serine/threonine-protein phosphatase 2A 55 kDa regulatory subunit B n=1 Tax=Spumella elongata TaxID=89044 RepID=A0A7S3HJU9_9STRA|mmetsp:Transcript_56435/g.99133  ORF Transcript_56435/g.99133 Transcript_56435/m.99133 type:complete len:463 (+) Transcript_56435:184-1572(+)|eukprot:gene10956-12782_t